MKQIYRLCTACGGEGVVEDLHPEKTKIIIEKSGLQSEEVDRPNIVPCYICKGKKILPSGYFIMESFEEFEDPMKCIVQLSDEEKKVIFNRT